MIASTRASVLQYVSKAARGRHRFRTMDTELIIISDGKLVRGYTDSTIDNQYIRTLWDVAPADGYPALPDGHYRGIFLGDGKMRIVYGGEYLNGYMMNQSFQDYRIEFKEKENEEYKEGFKRGYLGKRAVTWGRFERESAMWREGYQSGRYYRQLPSQAC